MAALELSHIYIDRERAGGGGGEGPLSSSHPLAEAHVGVGSQDSAQGVSCIPQNMPWAAQSVHHE